MNAVFVLDGRQINTKLQHGFIADSDAPVRAEDALRGSQMLRDAILRAKGYPVAEPEVIAVVQAPPVFKQRTAKLGRPKGDRKVRRINPKIIRIQDLIAAHFEISVSDIMASGKHFARPRQIAVYLARKTTTASLNDIGFHFGNRDHTTILHAVRVVAARAGNGDPKTIAALHAAYSGGVR